MKNGSAFVYPSRLNNRKQVKKRMVNRVERVILLVVFSREAVDLFDFHLNMWYDGIREKVWLLVQIEY